MMTSTSILINCGSSSDTCNDFKILPTLRANPNAIQLLTKERGENRIAENSNTTTKEKVKSISFKLKEEMSFLK